MNSVFRVLNNITICLWNLNGVKNKFMTPTIDNIFQRTDILIITETHFNKRTKCPKDFVLLESSPPIESKRPRGGVALYKRIHCSLEFITLLNLPDCIVSEVIDTNIIIIAIYIPPSTSPFFKEDYFENLKSIFGYFAQHKTVYVLGDLNSRFGEISNSKLQRRYKFNHDPTINTNGHKLRSLLAENPDLVLLNGLVQHNKTFDTNFTFSRGKSASQIDICLTNNLDNTESLKILKKTTLSDHNPVILTISIERDIPLALIEACAEGFLSYKHHDINAKIRRTVRMENCNLVNLVKDLEQLGNDLQLEYGNNITLKHDVDMLNQKITDGIYQACTKNRRREKLNDLLGLEDRSENLRNCDSDNFQAIADANVMYFHYLAERKDPHAQIYKDKWLHFQELAFLKDREDQSRYNSKQWKHLYSDKPKKMWELIDWKQKGQKEMKNLSPDVIAKFFRGIFQAKKIEKDPKLSEAQDLVNEYQVFCETTDKDISMEEIESARQKMNRGIGIDGISPNILSIAPQSLLEVIKNLYNGIFGKSYPDCWNEQLLLSFAKKDHTSKKASLRGIGIGPVLSRMYDTIINVRFGAWYAPNKEQAGFREQQGCLLQILALLMLIDLSKRLNKDMWIGVIDYEKAFDFTNRYRLCLDMMDKQFGKRFITNFMNSYQSTSYVVKASANEKGDTIKTDQGLTQGKTTSANYFSLFVSDMPSSLNLGINEDFMDPYYLFQLADDTTITAEKIKQFIHNMTMIVKYSIDKFLRIHPTKSMYFHLTDYDKLREDIILEEGITLKAIDDGYNWLGFWLCDSKDISEIINFHLSKKMVHISSFYSWLAVNEDTPFKIKLLVLYNCLFATMLYSCEIWVNLDDIVEKLALTEKKALKSILGIRSSTPDDLVYQEINQADIIATIRDRQYNFFKKIMEHEENAAVVIAVMNLYNSKVDAGSAGMIHYYQNLQPKNRKTNKEQRKNRIDTSELSMTVRYKEITITQYSSILYNSFMIERYRMVITRWRLSCHSLRIQTGRYNRPRLPRNERTCIICNVIEDEQHALFHCTAHIFIRLHYVDTLTTYQTVQSILNPNTIEDANNIGRYIIEIEKNMQSLDMVFKY